MALDEPTENDEIFNDNGLTFLVDKALWEQAKPITVDFITSPMGSGFRLSSNIAANGGCGTSCGTSCSC